MDWKEGKIVNTPLERQMKTSYIDYALSVIVTRALPEETRKTFEAQTSLGRFGEAQDIADAVLFLASDQAKYITGQTLHVNGGMLMP